MLRDGMLLGSAECRGARQQAGALGWAVEGGASRVALSMKHVARCAMEQGSS